MAWNICTMGEARSVDVSISANGKPRPLASAPTSAYNGQRMWLVAAKQVGMRESNVLEDNNQKASRELTTS